MDFAIPEDLKLLRKSVRRFVDEELLPLEREHAQSHDLPDPLRARLQARAKELGFWAFDLPPEYGGAGVGVLGTCIVLEELARSNVPAFRAPSVLTPWIGPVLFHCNDEQKKKYLLPVIRGEKRTCFALTEASGGSDAANMATRAVKDGADWVINGTKIFITHADKADFVQLFARTEGKGREGITCFLIDKGTPGLRLGQQFDLMSPDRPWELVIDNVRVSDAQVVGAVGGGWDLAREFLGMGRLVHGPKAVGRAERALALAIDWARERKTFGAPLASRQAIQWMIADSAVDIHTARLMIYHAAWKADRGLPYHYEASMVKLHADEMMLRVVDRAIQIHGGIGLARELPLEVMYREARSRLITEGSQEMQRIIIASELLAGRGAIDRCDD